jgi:hypothetical protein
MKAVRIEYAGWHIALNVRLSASDPSKWTASYEAESIGHLPLKGELTVDFSEPDRALDRALGDAIRAVNHYLEYAH